jgi:gamma-D-glutamyl-L-lysine dipeptidyl-peptidase
MKHFLLTVILAIMGSALLSVDSAAAQKPSSVPARKSPEQAYYERLIAKVEPGLVGSRDRLALYVQLFKREMITDTRLFPFEVAATADENGRVALDGFVGFEENRVGLLKFLRYLGFSEIDDGIEVLPSEKLGPRRFGLLKVSHSFSYDSPTQPQEVLTDCLLGDPLYLLKETDNGFFLCHAAEGYVGYVNGRDLRRVDREEFTRYQEGTGVFLQRNSKTQGGLQMPIGARLKLLERRGPEVAVELPGGGQAVVSADHCRVGEDGANPRLERVIRNALWLLGTDYVWGGNTSSGIDCSGLMQVAFAAEGINLPRDSSQQIYLGSLTATRWHRDRLRPGDTLFFLGKTGKISHTAIYLGDDQYLEAVRPVVRRTSFNPKDENFHAGRNASFCFAKRLLE